MNAQTYTQYSSDHPQNLRLLTACSLTHTQRYTKGDAAHVPRIGYAMFKKKFTAPSAAEGFKEVKPINFVLDFENDTHKQLFHHWA